MRELRVRMVSQLEISLKIHNCKVCIKKIILYIIVFSIYIEYSIGFILEIKNTSVSNVKNNLFHDLLNLQIFFDFIKYFLFPYFNLYNTLNNI